MKTGTRTARVATPAKAASMPEAATATNEAASGRAHRRARVAGGGRANAPARRDPRRRVAFGAALPGAAFRAMKRPTNPPASTTTPPASTPPERDNPASEARSAERLERARALLAQTLENPGGAKASHPAQPTPRTEYRAPPDPFEDADPFEPFEQCVPDPTPSAPPHVEPAFSESVYSRSTQSRGKASRRTPKPASARSVR